MRVRVVSIIAAVLGCILCGPDAAHGQGVEQGGPAFESLWPHDAHDAHDAMVPPAVVERAARDSVCIAAATNESVGVAATPQARTAADRREVAIDGEQWVVQPGPGKRTRKDVNLATAYGTTGDPATWPCVADILARAKAYTSANHFIVPARDNALEAYVEALRVSSRYREAARAGIEAIKNQYAMWATEAEGQNDWSGAAAFYRKALAAIPGDDAIVAALKRVEDHGEESAVSDRAGSTARAAAVSLTERAGRETRVDSGASGGERQRLAVRRCVGASEPASCSRRGRTSHETQAGIFLATKIHSEKPEANGGGDAHRAGKQENDEDAVADTVRARSVSAAGKRWSVQVTAVRDPEMAIAHAAYLRAAGYPAYVATFKDHGAAWRRVRIGPFASRVAAGRAATRLRAREHLPGAFIISN